MEKLVRGDVVVILFPFSNLSDIKKRPALVLKQLKGNDVIVCQITSQTNNDTYSVPLDNTQDMICGNLDKKSNIRPNKIFTADRKIIDRKIGSVKSYIIEDVVKKITELITK